MVKQSEFDVTINYTAPENQKAYEERVAKMIINTLSVEQIDELTMEYKKEKIKSNDLCF